MKEYIVRYEKNPIITKDDLPFRGQCVFNSGAAIYNNQIIMLLNCWDRQWVPKFLVAKSTDGVNFDISDKTVVAPPREYPYCPTDGIFDTRITFLEGYYYITYNVSSHLGGRIMLMRSKDFEDFEEIGFITGIDHRNCVIFPEKIDGYYVRLERPAGESSANAGDIYISYSPDLVFWGKTKLLLEKGTRWWESCKIGPGAPPVKTEKGWLIIYHGCREHMNGIMYSAGCMLLDIHDPSKIIGKMGETLIEPQELYEQIGNVPQVVFPTAAIPHGEPDELKIYYGAADSSMCLATASISELVDKCLVDGPINYSYKH